MFGLNPQDLLWIVLILLVVVLIFAGWLSRKHLGCGVLIGLLTLAAVGYAIFSPKTPTAPVSTPSVVSTPPRAADTKTAALASIEVSNLGWYKGGFDSVMFVNATFRNNSERDVKDIELTCEHFSNSGTNLGRNRQVIYEIVTTKRTKTVKDFSMGFIHAQVTKIRCYVSNVALVN